MRPQAVDEKFPCLRILNVRLQRKQNNLPVNPIHTMKTGIHKESSTIRPPVPPSTIGNLNGPYRYEM